MTSTVLFSSASDNWPTPQSFYDRLNAEFAFVLDACSSVANHKADAFYALDHPEEARRDGLAGDWARDAETLGGAVWMNPPYGRGIAAWMEKAHATAQANAVVVCLVPVRADAAWWHELVLGTGAEVRYIRGRLTFGTAKNAAPFASAVVIYRPTDKAGAPGPVATMSAKAPQPEPEPAKPPTRVGGPRHTPKQVADFIADYTPRTMSAATWTVCAEAVRGAVTATAPTTTQVAGTYLTSLVAHLAGPCGWDKTNAPDLAMLLSEQVITRTWQRGEASPRSASVRRSHLRAIARANGLAPVRQPLANPHPRKVDAFIAEGTRRGIPLATVVAAWRSHTGRSLTAEPLDPVIAALRGCAATDTTACPSTVWAPATLRSLSDANDQHQKAPVSSTPAAPTRPAVATTATKPMSRRAVLRYARQAQAARATADGSAELAPAPKVTAEVRAAVEGYAPHKANRQTWNTNIELAQRLVFGYGPTSARNAANVCSQVACFLTWFASWPARAVSGPITAGELIAPGVFEAWVASSGRSDRSRATMRSTLRRAVGSLFPGVASEKLSYKPAAAPYSPKEMATWRFLAANQPTPAATANQCFIVGLCAGAGLDAGDLRHLTPEAFATAWLDATTSVLMVTVSNGPRSRTVPIRGAYADLVRKGLAAHDAAGKTANDLILGKVAERTNVASSKSRAAKTATEPLTVQVTRLRNTWLLAVMCAPVSLADLLTASGMRSGRTLTDLLPYCPEPDEEILAATVATLASATDTGAQR